jgi:hypothetical protein
MADAVEALWQNMHQEAADELVGIERHLLVSLGAFDATPLSSIEIRRRLEIATRWV